MKKIILTLIFILSTCYFIQSEANAQYSTPSGYTSNFRLRLYSNGANPGADSLNANLTNIDTELKNRDKRIDSLKSAFSVSLNFPAGTIRSNTIGASQTNSGFMHGYFYRDAGEGWDRWVMRVDLAQFDNDTVKIKDGYFGKLGSANSWTGIQSFGNERTNFGDATNAVMNFNIANDLGAITIKKNSSTTLAKWDESDGTYWQFLYSVDVTGDVSVSGKLKYTTAITDAAADNNSLFLGSEHSNKPCWKDGSGTVHVLY